MNEPQSEENSISPEEQLTHALSAAFKTESIRVQTDPHKETLYIEIGGIDHLSEQEIERLAGPVLDEFDSDYEEIIILPMP